jgi:hypothetical protein
VLSYGGLQDRLILRYIERGLPERIIREDQRRFTDITTGYRIAVATRAILGRAGNSSSLHALPWGASSAYVHQRGICLR